MDDLVGRVFIAVVVVAAALIAARATRGLQRPTHPPVDLSATELPHGVLVFTSSDCDNCRAVRGALKDLGVSFREVTWELEPAVFEAAGIESVPLVVVRDASGATRGQMAGRPRRRRLRSLVASVSGPSVANP